MAIYVVCPVCKMEYSAKKNSCPKCGVKKPPNGSYRISISYKGSRLRETVSGVSYQTAKTIEAKLKVDIVSGTYLGTSSNSDILFSEFMKEYFAFENKISIKKEKTLYNRHLSVLNNKTLQEITMLDAEKIVNSILKKGLAVRTAEYVVSVLRHALNKAVERGYLQVNPISKIKVPRKDNRRIRFLTKNEAIKLLNELKKRSQRTYEMAFLSLNTGMRFGEIASLTWQDIDFDNDIIYIKDPKNRKGRVAYMIEEVREFLKNKKQNSDTNSTNSLIFSTKKHDKMTTITNSFKHAVNRLGLNKGITDPRDKVVFHTLRHTFASWLVQDGTPLYTVKELLGHKSIAMTERYSHLAESTMREAVKKLKNKLKKRV
jgi:integrase